MANIKQSFKRWLSAHSIGRWVLDYYLLFRDPKYAQYLRRTNAGFKRAGEEALNKIVDVFETLHIDYWLTFGTLLGAVREKGFIKHDGDIDVAIFAKDYSDELLQSICNQGFSLYRRIDIYSKLGEVQGFELAFFYKNCQIDIFMFYPEKDCSDKVYTFDFIGNVVDNGETVMFKTVRKLTLPWGGFAKTLMCGREMQIPAVYDEYLSTHYGSNYMVPDASWSNLGLTNITVIDDAVGVITTQAEVL